MERFASQTILTPCRDLVLIITVASGAARPAVRHEIVCQKVLPTAVLGVSIWF